MCQMRIVLEEGGKLETVMENVTHLETTADGIQVSTLFEEPKTIASARVKKIDFLGGMVTLIKGEKEQG